MELGDGAVSMHADADRVRFFYQNEAEQYKCMSIATYNSLHCIALAGEKMYAC